MPGDDPLPFAFRATAYYRTSRWLRRRVRAFRYNVQWRDGTVDRDIDLVKVMYRQAPADYQVTETGMMKHTPDIGTGRWIAYAYGARSTDQPSALPAFSPAVQLSAVAGGQL